jgi:DNA invertase Pin-like site-specific DNA recombinase
MQLAEVREYAGRRGWQIVEEFTDQGVSGCNESRPALNRLMSDACRRRFDAILVWKIDRFGRSLKHPLTRWLSWQRWELPSSASETTWTSVRPQAGSCSRSLVPWLSSNRR